METRLELFFWALIIATFLLLVFGPTPSCKHCRKLKDATWRKHPAGTVLCCLSCNKKWINVGDGPLELWVSYRWYHRVKRKKH